LLEAYRIVAVHVRAEFGYTRDREDEQHPAKQEPANVDDQPEQIAPVKFARIRCRGVIGVGLSAPAFGSGRGVGPAGGILSRPANRIRVLVRIATVGRVTHRPPSMCCWVWAVYKSWYIPRAASNWAWVPCSTTSPASITTITSAARIVDNRCAITTEVRPCCSFANASWMSASVRVSTDDVASSRISRRGLDKNARAMVSNWRSPVEMASESRLTSVSYPLGS